MGIAGHIPTLKQLRGVMQLLICCQLPFLYQLEMEPSRPAPGPGVGKWTWTLDSTGDVSDGTGAWGLPAENSLISQERGRGPAVVRGDFSFVWREEEPEC